MEIAISGPKLKYWLSYLTTMRAWTVFLTTLKHRSHGQRDLSACRYLMSRYFLSDSTDLHYFQKSLSDKWNWCLAELVH